VRWVDGVRARPKREIERTGTVPTLLASDGSNAADFLVEEPKLLEAARRFYAKLNPGRDLDILEARESLQRITLNPRSRDTFRIDLVDTGEGMAQVLPVLVAASLAADERTAGLLAIEEPESHLHPDAQAILASHLCEIAAQVDPPTIVIETHSRVFLLAVQLAVAKGLSPDRVGLAWIDQDLSGRSSVTSVDLSPSGHPRAGWPVAALGEDIDLAGELARLDLSREV
jgi:hypothetical protein